MSTKTALVLVANGSEEMEAVTVIDTLRRAGVDVTVAGVHDANPVTMSRNVVLVPDKSLAEATAGNVTFDAVLLPGGLKGAEAFSNSTEVGKLLKDHEQAGRLIGAVCAGPTALKSHAIGLGKAITSYPGVKDKLTGYDYKEDRVVVGENLITSRGPGTSLEWALTIVEHLVGKEKAAELGNQMLLKL